jgi:septum formation protein
MSNLILASASASRRAMLVAAGVAHEVIVSQVDESAIKARLLAEDKDPRAIGLALATAKALAVSEIHPGRWVLGGDSLVSAGGRLFDKPISREDAAEHLRFFSGKLMTLDSSAVLARDGAMIDYASDDAHLEVRTLSDAFITAYLDKEWPAISGCVGCFRIEALGVHLFEVITGSHFTVLGMPLLPVLDRLRTYGVIEG